MQKIDWIKACRKIVSEAGEKILGLYTSGDKNEEIDVGYGGDITLKADKVAEDTIIEGMSKLDVAVKLLSEEAGEISLGEEHEYTLIVDPLDGSFNYSTGVSYFGISIAVMDEKRDTIAGYILDVPNRTEFYATQEGAFKDGRQISTAQRKNLDRVLVESSREADLDSVAHLCSFLSMAKHVRAPGAVALNLCKVADGTFDCFAYAGCSRYLDLASGIYILERAGGLVYDFQGNKRIRQGTSLQTKNLLAVANKDIYEIITRRT